MEIQGKTTLTLGLKKSVHKSILKDGEYHHLKNGFVSSFEGDIPFIQNAPSNIECLQLPEGFLFLGSEFIKEKNFHIIFIRNPKTGDNEIGYFYSKECKYETKISNKCFDFNESFPIKCKYQFIKCELHIYFQDGNQKNRHINLDNPPYVKIKNSNNCLEDSDILDCSAINIQNDLIPPVVKPKLPIEAGALYTGVYQFAVCYANINGDEQSSYYSKTNPLPIYEDRFGAYEDIEGSIANKLTDKAIPVEFSNLDTRYDYINIAVIKTIQGTPTYELVATLPITTKEYLYTGREVTKLLSIDKLLGLYPDYYNSKTITSANNYLLMANMSTQDEANYQPFASLIELEWVATRKKADTFESSYKNPIMSVETKGYQRGEVYAFGIQFLLSNGRKTSVFHIPGRKATNSDLIKYTKDTIPTGQDCNFYEFSNDESCSKENISELYHWQVYDTATIIERLDETSLDKCFDGIIAYGDFAYWESTDTYPCNQDVWKNLSGKSIRHHKFPSNETFYHHNQPYTYSEISGEAIAYDNNDSYIYPIGIRLKKELSFYIQKAINLGYITDEEANLITGYEIVRSDRTGNKSIIGKGLLYNMKYYIDINPSTNISEQVLYPNYPFNDLRTDPYLSNEFSNDYDYVTSNVAVADYYIGHSISTGVFGNPYSVTFTLDRDIIGLTEDFSVSYQKIGMYGSCKYIMIFRFYGDDRDNYEDFSLEQIDIGYQEPISTGLYKKDLFTFHSPETSFKKPFIGQEIILHSIEYGSARGRFDQVQGHPEFKPANRTDSANYACAFKSISNYNNYSPIEIQNYRRQLVDQGYLIGNNFTKLPQTDTKINNRFRESSVGLKLNCSIDDPSIIDESRYTISSNGQCSCKSIVEDRILDKKNAFEVDSQCTEDYKWISSYYGSLKTKIPNQYGQIDTVKYILTGSYHNTNDKPVPIFGGDIFISRFSLKRKNSFFRVNFIGQSPVGITYRGTKYANLLTPIYHADNEKGGALGEYKIDFSTSKLDCSIDNAQRNGFFYLFSTGIVNFFVESDINTELRYSGANIQDTWYPKLKNTNVWDWMEEQKVSINLDNTYYYNFDYSKQNTEEALFTQAPDFKPNSQCKNTHPRRIVYSKQNNQESSADNWLVYPANNYYDVDSAMGDIIDIEALDTFKVLVRCENGSMVFNAYDTLQLTNTSVTVGTGGMFSQRPQTFAETDTGYAGSQSKWALNISQHGSFFLDQKRGKVFHYTSQLEEISTNGMFDWFAENSKFKILEQVSNVNTDNPYTGIGYTSVFDNRFNLWFLTKRDYKLKNIKELGNLSLDENNNILYKGKLADFNNKKIWKNLSWTVSYSPLYKSWISFHSFIPNYYMGDINTFYSGKQNQKIYKHWDKFSFQTYYGEKYPFEITITTAKEQEVSLLKSIEYNLKVQKYLNNNYQDLYENHNINFNKLIVSTDNQSSGILNLIKQEKNNPFQSLQYPKINSDSLDVLYSKVEGHQYRVNQFADLVLDKNNNQAIFIHDENGVDKIPNNIEYQKINNLQLQNQKFRNEFFDITLINDKETDYKFILKTQINKTIKSIR